MRRRTVVVGLAGLGAAIAAPAFAQSIRRQTDPYGQVDPYADPRNGFPSTGGAGRGREAGPSAAGPRPVFGDRLGLSPEEEAEEIAAGRVSYAYNMKKWGGPHPDPRLQTAVRRFFAPLAKVADRAHLPWEITLVTNPTANACAMAGGKVLVNTGLFGICDRPGELAATLAHEIGHVDYGHVRNDNFRQIAALAHQMGLNAALSGPLDILVPGAAKAGADMAGLFELAYSREAEFEADEHVLVIFDRLGVDPVHAVNDQRNFLTYEKMVGAAERQVLLMSHPPTPERLANIEHKAAMAPRRSADYAFPDWDVLKAAFPTHPAFKKA